MINYTKKFALSTLSILVFSILVSIFNYLIRIFLTKNLSVYEYGLLYSIFTFVLFFSFFQDLGFGSTLVKYISKFNVKKEYGKIKASIIYAFSIQLFFTILIILILGFLSRFLSINFFHDKNSQKMLLIFLVWFFFNSIYTTILFVFYGFQKMFIFSLQQFSSSFFILVFAAIFLKLQIASNNLPYIWLFASVINVIIFSVMLYFLTNIKNSKAEYSKHLLKQLISFALPIMLIMTSSLIITYSDTIILTLFKTIEEVGIYNVVLPSAMLFVFLGKSFALAIFPISSELDARKDNIKLQNGLRILTRYVLVTILPLILGLIFFAALFLKIFFGNEYIYGALSLQILLVGVFFFVLAQINQTIISGIGKPKIFSKIILKAALLNIFLNFLVVPKYGMVGAAFSTTVSYSLIFILTQRKVRSLFDIKYSLVDIFKIFISAIIFIFSIYILKNGVFGNSWGELILILFLSGLIYLISIFVLKLVAMDEIKQILKRILKKDQQ